MTKGPLDAFLSLAVADCVNARYYPRTVPTTECCGAMTGFPEGAYETWCIRCNEQTCTACAGKLDTDDEGYVKATCKECRVPRMRDCKACWGHKTVERAIDAERYEMVPCEVCLGTGRRSEGGERCES